MTGNNTGTVNHITNTDAYKGDGFQGLGQFLEGVGRAYGIVDFDSTTNRSRLTDEDLDKFYKALDCITEDYKDSKYTKGLACYDAKCAMDSIFKTHRDRNLPELYGRACVAGLYNSSSLQLLANDAYARTVAEASKLKLDWITQYASIRQAHANAMIQMLRDMADIYETTVVDNRTANKPDISTFATHAAAYLLFTGILDLFSKRKYFADP